MHKPGLVKGLSESLLITIGVLSVIGLINLHDASPTIFSALWHMVAASLVGSLLLFRVTAAFNMRPSHHTAKQQLRRATGDYLVLINVGDIQLIRHLTLLDLAMWLGLMLGTFFGREVMKVSQERRMTRLSALPPLIPTSRRSHGRRH